MSRHTSPTHVDPNSDTDAYGHASTTHTDPNSDTYSGATHAYLYPYSNSYAHSYS